MWRNVSTRQIFLFIYHVETYLQLNICHVEKLLYMTICHMEKFLHMADFFSTSTAGDAGDKYQVCLWYSTQNKGGVTEKNPLREAPPIKTVYIWALLKLLFDPPYCANPGTLWHNFFAAEPGLDNAYIICVCNLGLVQHAFKIYRLPNWGQNSHLCEISKFQYFWVHVNMGQIHYCRFPLKVSPKFAAVRYQYSLVNGN